MWRSDPSGPQGPMQVSEAAAADVGGGDRFDSIENRAIGRAYLAQLYRRYKNWPDAIAAYNWGMGNVDNWISAGRPSDKFVAGVAAYLRRVLHDSGMCDSSTAAPADPRERGRYRRTGNREKVRTKMPTPRSTPSYLLYAPILTRGEGYRTRRIDLSWWARPLLLQTGKGHGVGDAALADVKTLRRRAHNCLFEDRGAAPVRSGDRPRVSSTEYYAEARPVSGGSAAVRSSELNRSSRTG